MSTPTSQACERCWRRKQKCARDFPCLQCREASKECVRRRQGSVAEGFDPGIESYVETLKARVASLRMRVAEGAATESHGADLEVAASKTPTDTLPKRQTPRQSRDDMHSTMQEASYLSLSAMAERTDKHGLDTGGLSFRSLLTAAVNARQRDHSAFNGQDDSNMQSFVAVNELLCKGDPSAPYHAYTQHIRSTYPYIELPRLQNAYQYIINLHSRGTASMEASISPEHYVTVYLGLATGMLLSPGYDRHENVAEDLVKCSLEAFNYVLDISDDLAAVHCLIALTICSLFCAKAGSTWHLLGLAMTRGVACGMHTGKQPHSGLQTSPTEHTRAFWTLFLLDTHVSSALDRPFYLDDSAVAALENYAPEDNLSHLIAQARILRAMRKSERGVLCNFINLQHLHETTAGRNLSGKTGDVQAYAAGLVELFKYSVVVGDSSCKMIVTEAGEVFAKYLALLEDHLVMKATASTSLDVMLVLAMGVIMYRLHVLGQTSQQQTALQAINILTLLSTRYSHARGLRDILMECLMPTIGADTQQPNARLRGLIGKLEIQLPSRIETVIFDKRRL